MLWKITDFKLKWMNCKWNLCKHSQSQWFYDALQRFKHRLVRKMSKDVCEKSICSIISACAFETWSQAATRLCYIHVTNYALLHWISGVYHWTVASVVYFKISVRLRCQIASLSIGVNDEDLPERALSAWMQNIPVVLNHGYWAVLCSWARVMWNVLRWSCTF